MELSGNFASRHFLSFKVGRIAIFCCAGLLATACNNIFYQPDQIIRIDPSYVDAPFSVESVRTADGEDLAIWRLHGTSPRLGTILHFHGNAQNMSTHFLFVAWLTTYGFDVVTFDYRGYGQSTGRPSRSGVHADSVAVLAKISAEEKDNLFIYAQSLGGAIAPCVIAQVRPENLRALALESTFDSYRAIAQAKLGALWLTWPLQVPLSYLVSDELSPKTCAANIEVPLLLIHGTTDPVVPIESGEALYQSFASKDREIWRIQGGGHTPAFVEGSPYRRAYVEFLCLRHTRPDECRKRVGLTSP